MERKIIWLGLMIGSLTGSYLKLLWGGSVISMSSVFTSAIGGIFGIWLAFRITKY